MSLPAPQVRMAALDKADEAARIEAFVAAQGGTVFHRPAWLTAVAQGAGARPVGLVAERGAVLTGWLPLSDVRSRLFGRALVSSGFAVGGGILSEDDAARASLAAAGEGLAVTLAAGSIELRGGARPRGKWQEICGRHANFAAALRDDDHAQLLAIPRRARAEVRKGLQQDLVVTHGSDVAHRKGHYCVMGELLRNHGTPAFPRALYDAVLDTFGDDAEITLVRCGSRPVAGVLSLYHAGSVMPFWGGGTREGKALRAAERMYYELMCHARRRGAQCFDFGRSKTGSGPFAFKKNWGFTPDPLTYWMWTPPGRTARSIDPTDASFSARIALWQRLPVAIANRVGPFIARGLG